MAVVAIASCDIAGVAAQSSFFDGKTIRLIVGYPAGTTHDIWARTVTPYLKKYLPGNPDFVVESIAGAGFMVAVNYLNGVAKPDGLTLATFNAALYFEQLIGRKEVQFDWPKLAWIGSSTPATRLFYIRADHPFATIADLRRATEPAKCGTAGRGNSGYILPKLFEETLGLKLAIVTGYPGGGEVDLATEKGEVQCNSTSLSVFFGREPFHTLAQEELRARADSDRQQARCPARRRADDLRAYGSVQDAGGEPPFDRSISRRRTLRFLAHRRSAGVAPRADKDVSRRFRQSAQRPGSAGGSREETTGG